MDLESNHGVSVETKIATMVVTLENLKDTILGNLGRQDKILERIEVQTTRTNGRMTVAEESVRNLQR